MAPPIEEPEGDEELLELGVGVDDGAGGEGGGEKERRFEKEVIDDSEDELAL